MQQSSYPQNRWAFLVGVNDYDDQSTKTLNYCVNDVKSLDTLLTAAGYTVICMHDELANRDARFPRYGYIKAEFKKIKDRLDPTDLLLVYFACHGIRDSKDGIPRLIAQDTRMETLSESAITVADVEDWMRESGAGQLVLMLDACHMGQGTDERDIVRYDPDGFSQAVRERIPEGFALLAASTAGQVSRELQDIEHGLFSYYVLSGLAGQAKAPNSNQVTLGSLKQYVMGELTKEAIKQGISQKPQGRLMGDLDIEEMVLVDIEKLTVVRKQFLEDINRLSSAAVSAAGSNRQQSSDSDVKKEDSAEKEESTTLQVPDQLSGNEYGRLVDALMSAFPDREALALMVRRKLGEKLNIISQGASGYETTVDRLVEWAEARGELQTLVEGAIARNPKNPELRKLTKSWER